MITFIYIIIGLTPCWFLTLLAIASFREKRPRAAAVGIVTAMLYIMIWFGLLILSPAENLLLIPITAAIMFTAAFFIPAGRIRPMEIGAVTERVDERDIMFAREEYHPGSDKYAAYYSHRPENRDIDDKIRALPELLAPGGKFYDPIRSPCTDAVFEVIHNLITEVDGPVASDRIEVDPAAMTSHIKEMAGHLGADEIGIARLNPMFVYSHVGRGPEPWGAPIVNNHQFVIAFTLEMDYDRVETAPRLPITEETAAKYLKGTIISLALARYIRDLGYSARAHVSGSNYQIMLPPVAYDAGLGELGRHGYLISPRFGSRIRLGAVTTDLPLMTGKPITFGVREFCEKCLRCAVNCPSSSIPKNGPSEVRGVRKWPLEVESCLRYWRLIGTDCGLCMKVCPFSHPPSTAHRIIRAGIKRSLWARWLSVHGEELFYGRKASW